MDAYSQIQNFEIAISEWQKARLLKERVLFRKMMNLILDPIGQINPRIAMGEDKHAGLLLVSRIFNAFESAMRLTLMGLGEQAYMPMRDSIETSLLINLFAVDGKLAYRWMTNLNEYHASDVIAMLKEKGVDLPLNELYGTFSQLGHPNFVASVHTVEEVEQGEGQILRTYHFGGYRNEGFMTIQIRNILMLQIASLTMAICNVYRSLHPDYDTWWIEVKKIPSLLRGELGLDIEDESRELDHIGRKLAIKLKIDAFDSRLTGVNETL